jgi:hypothetical protein
MKRIESAKDRPVVGRNVAFPVTCAERTPRARERDIHLRDKELWGYPISQQEEPAPTD